MLAEIFRFELRHHLRSAVFWIAAVVFFLLSFGAVSTDAVVIGGAVGNVHRNAPFVITQIVGVMSIIAVFVTTAFVAGAVLRDADHKTEEILYATPMGKMPYLLGRFGGAFTATVLVILPVVLGILIGTSMPWLDPERLGPVMPGAYGWALAVMAIPNLLLMAAIFFGLATLTRSLMGTYVGLVAFFVGYGVSGALLSDVENTTLASLLDPFGFGAFGVASRYWTTAQRNTVLPAVEGPLLWNRLLWLGVALLVLAVTFATFSFTRTTTRKGRKAAKEAAEGKEGAAAEVAEEDVAHVPAPRPTAGRGELAIRPAPRAGPSAARQLLRQARAETRGVLVSLPFLIILAFGVLNLVGNATVIDQFAGTPVWPVTHLMLDVIDSGFLLFSLIIVTLYAGELVWRERQQGVADVLDAMPVPSWVYWGGKALALAAVLLMTLVVGVVTAVLIQLYHGYTHLEPGLYLTGIFAEMGLPFLLLAVLALAAQVLVNNKYLGFLVMVLYFIALPVLTALDVTHNLVFYGLPPGTPYSDLNGYGHLWTGAAWFLLYWSFAALVLLALVHLFWVRGRETGLRERLSLARQRLGGATVGVLVLAAVGFGGTGAWIYYNTDVLNDFESPEVGRDRAERYEREYKRFEDAAQPRITSVYAEVDIFPEEREVAVDGRYLMVNPHDVPVDTLHLVVSRDLDVEALEVPGAERVHHDEDIGWSMWRFEEPMAPGDSLVLSYALRKTTEGFTNEPGDLELAHNGTFFNNAGYFPHIGYTRGRELQDPNERRKRGLDPVERMPKLEDPSGRERNYITSESDWIDFETVVSTSADQVALAPGERVESWTEGDRRYFRYRSTEPILGFWAYLSGDWTVTEDRWEDVSIDVYHHPDHTYNVDRMIDAVKKSLDYYTEAFGPYQHDYVRIVEFPRYSRFAQAFPGTVPFSESIGFIARLEDPDDIDYPFYVTAHEVAHQWWAHQVVGGFQQGATVLSETLAQYSALMVMEEEYGEEKMRRFLRYELDQYLRGRGGELVEELPLHRVENQGYIHYRKGSLVMYALQDLVGEERVNEALSRFLDDHRFAGPPYPTSEMLLAHLAEEVPAEMEGILDDLFRRIVLYDLRAEEATAEPTGDGRWRVRLAVEATKLEATGQGEETPIPMADWVDVAVFGAEGPDDPPEGSVLALEKRRLTPADSVLVFIVDEEPVRAGIDPFNKLIDRDPSDNVTGVEAAGG